MLANMPAMHRDRIMRILRKGVTFSTHYSGTGFFEMTMDRLATALGVPPGHVQYHPKLCQNTAFPEHSDGISK